MDRIHEVHNIELETSKRIHVVRGRRLTTFPATVKKRRKQVGDSDGGGLPCQVKNLQCKESGANPTLASQSMHASQKLTSLGESVRNLLQRKIMKIILQERDSIH